MSERCKERIEDQRAQRLRSWRLVAVPLVSAFAVTLSPDTAACAREGADWGGNFMTFQVNANDFAASFALPSTQFPDDVSVPLYEIFWSSDPNDPPLLALNPLPAHAGEPYLISYNRANVVSNPWTVDWTYIITTH